MRVLYFTFVSVLAFWLVGCAPNTLNGEIDGHSFDVVDAVHFEFRGTDAGTSLPTHPIILWLMPVDDACSVWPQLQSDMRALVSQLDDGQDPNEFCAEWADRWSAFSGGEAFWMNQIRLAAQPREEGSTPDGSYTYLDEDGAQAPESPWFDASFAWHEAPTLERCAEVFGGTDYLPAQFVATGGEIAIDRYVEDDAISGTITLEMEGQGDEGVTGAFDSTFCPAADEFDLTIPLAL